MNNYTFTYEGDGYSLIISFDYSPSTPDVHTLPNGDPGYPGDPEELCITQVSYVNAIHNKIDLTDTFLDDFSLFERFETLCREHLEGLSYEDEGPDDQPDDSGPF